MNVNTFLLEVINLLAIELKNKTISNFYISDGFDDSQHIPITLGNIIEAQKVIEWLKYREQKLSALETYGVDTWCGYEDAMSSFDNAEDDSDDE